MDRGGGVELRRFERFAGRSVAGLLAVLALGAGFGLLSLLVRFEWTPLNRLDGAVSAELNAVVADRRWLVAVLDVLTSLGGGLLLTGLVTVVGVGLLIRGQRRPAAYLVVAGLGPAALSPSLKMLVGRLRPVVDEPVAAASGMSFPSGHALGATVTYGALLLVFLPVIRRRRRAAAIASTAVLVVLIGATRVALGVHYVSDVVAGLLLGLAWLGVTAAAFRLWRRESGRPASISRGIEPEAAGELTPAPRERHVLPHARAGAAEIVTGWVFVLGVLVVIGTFLERVAESGVAGAVDDALPRWLAEHRTPALDDASYWLSKAGDTHSILAVSLVFCPLAVAVLRRWRPVLFVALVMIGEITLFMASSTVVGRGRPDVPQLDGSLPTTSFPSGHVAATLCLYTAIAVVVVPRARGVLRWAPIAAVVVVPAAVALSRLYRGMHHPTDVLGAVLLTALWVGLLWWVIRPTEPDDPARAVSADPDAVPANAVPANAGAHAAPAGRAAPTPETPETPPLVATASRSAGVVREDQQTKAP